MRVGTTSVGVCVGVEVGVGVGVEVEVRAGDGVALSVGVGVGVGVEVEVGVGDGVALSVGVRVRVGADTVPVWLGVGVRVAGERVGVMTGVPVAAGGVGPTGGPPPSSPLHPMKAIAANAARTHRPGFAPRLVPWDPMPPLDRPFDASPPTLRRLGDLPTPTDLRVQIQRRCELRSRSTTHTDFPRTLIYHAHGAANEVNAAPSRRATEVPPRRSLRSRL